jgi:type IV secretion system protein VirB11
VTNTLDTYLGIYLAPIAGHLARADVTDIYINRPGEFWSETLSGHSERIAAPDLTEELLWRLARQVASLTHQGISRQHPLLAGTLPDGARVQIVAPPATRGSMALALRRHVAVDLTLGDYDDAGGFTTTRRLDHACASDGDLQRLYTQGAWSKFLGLAVRTRRTILVSGGTSSGKTTLLNALLREIPADERLVLIEDTPELVLRHANAVGLVAARGTEREAAVTAEDLLIASLRLRPERIVMGEVRGPEALTFLRAINTGHSGSLSTIHADSPERALEQLALLVLQTGTHLRMEDVLGYARRVIEICVQLSRDGGRRRVSQIAWFRHS